MARYRVIGVMILAGVMLAGSAGAQEAKKMAPPATLKSILLEQLKSSHNKAEWFVPANTAVEGLTAEQANWKDGKGNHSIGQLAYHLVFWNQRELAKLTGHDPGKFNGNNDETFTDLDAKSWPETVKALDKVMMDLEKVVANADDEKLKKIASEIAHIGTHNAYHVGQILYIRKQQGWWNPAKGVN